ncbi:MAG: family 43 glycosylhydrolase [Lachnospiraceae bacterium]|nr:family 43 glycosylhydrolase [Lachnospiraceae bacterium]
MAEIDVETGALTSEIKSIWNGTGGGFLEAPHLYHIGGWYYIFAAEGGTNFNHMITVGRSRDIWGPYQAYEKNPILSNRNDTTKTVACSGHGDLVEDKNGNWWIVHLATRPVNNWLSHIGRETFLMPVTWQEEWPVIGNDCKSHIQADGSLWETQKPLSSWEADFSSQQFAPRLLFLRSPSHENYVLKNGSLFLKPSMVDLCEAVGSPTLIILRQPDISCEIFAKMNFKTCENGDEAGMTVYLSNRFFYKFCKKRINDKDYLLVEKFADDFQQTAFCMEAENGILNFKITARPEKYDFYYFADADEPHYLCSAATRFLSCELAGKCFTGVMTGLYAVCRQSTPAEAEILSFKTDCH